MATYKSAHTGEDIDKAIDIIKLNVDKGDEITPVYIGPDGLGIPIEKSTYPEEGDEKLITSGGVYEALQLKYNKADISTDENLGEADDVIPSQKAIKSYIDILLEPKQEKLEAGDDILISGNTISVDPTNVLLEEDLEKYANVVESPEFKIGTNVGVLSALNHEMLKGTSVGSDTYIEGEEEITVPYSLTKTGKRIVDGSGRGLVQDLYHKLGYTIYYTKTGSDYSLPTTGPEATIDRGANWEKRADLVVKQWGVAVEGEPVVFEVPYATDESFIVTLPYSSKTKEGFVPAVSGDWMANGKISIGE